MSQQLNFFASEKDTSRLEDCFRENKVAVVTAAGPSRSLQFLVDSDHLEHAKALIDDSARGFPGATDFDWAEYTPSIALNVSRVVVGRIYWAHSKIAPTWLKSVFRWCKENSKPLPDDHRFRVMPDAELTASQFVAWAGVTVNNSLRMIT
jgi:hypothetical protein